MLSEPLLTAGVILAIALVGIVAVKLEDWLRAWARAARGYWKWRHGPGWIEGRKRRSPRKPPKE